MAKRIIIIIINKRKPTAHSQKPIWQHYMGTHSPCFPFTTSSRHLHSFPRPTLVFSLFSFFLFCFFSSRSPLQSSSHPCRDAVIPSPLFISMMTTIVAPSPCTTRCTSALMELPHSRAISLTTPIEAQHACTATVNFSSPSHYNICLWRSFQIWWFGLSCLLLGWVGLVSKNNPEKLI